MRSHARGREQTTAPILVAMANQGLTAISTEPPCTQLTPSSAERARRERRHPTASTAEKTLALAQLKSGIDVKQPFDDWASVQRCPFRSAFRACTLSKSC